MEDRYRGRGEKKLVGGPSEEDPKAKLRVNQNKKKQSSLKRALSWMKRKKNNGEMRGPAQSSKGEPVKGEIKRCSSEKGGGGGGGDRRGGEHIGPQQPEKSRKQGKISLGEKEKRNRTKRGGATTSQEPDRGRDGGNNEPRRTRKTRQAEDQAAYKRGKSRPAAQRRPSPSAKKKCRKGEVPKRLERRQIRKRVKYFCKKKKGWVKRRACRAGGQKAGKNRWSCSAETGKREITGIGKGGEKQEKKDREKKTRSWPEIKGDDEVGKGTRSISQKKKKKRFLKAPPHVVSHYPIKRGKSAGVAIVAPGGGLQGRGITVSKRRLG